ncbi:MAG: flagellar hook-basal body complex protein [Phycisphaerales bacterium]|nr:flagellar hook-basal body complex protein [Phycisphaerales bacterium]
MGLSTAMYTALTGMNSNQFTIDTVGNNIANLNTISYKSNRATFENQFSLMLSAGTAPGATTGGTNPTQMGLGSTLGSVQKNFQPGAIETTGVPTDIAIEGNGFLVIQTPIQQAYTRDGTLKLDADNILVTAQGYKVRGYGIDSDFNIIPGVLSDLEIPLGTLASARATSQAGFDGNLNASGTIGTQETILFSQALEEGPGTPATAATLLVDLYDGDPLKQGASLFAEGDIITVANAKKGGRQVPEATFTVTATSTLGDYLKFLNNALAINEDPDAPGNPGITVSDQPGSEGMIVISGNVGTENALEISRSAIRSTNQTFNTPFTWTQQQEANGESVYTSFLAYDSLGTPVQVEISMVLEQKSNAGNTWRFYAQSRSDTDDDPVLGTGTLTFDNDGRLTAVTGDTIAIDRENTGAVTPLEIKLDFRNVTGLTTRGSNMVMTLQDGYGTGTLTGFSIGTDGVITGTFSNGLTRNLGQLALATFTNPEGLISDVNNLYLVGPNSGNPIITTPGSMGAGRTLGGALELSNVDMTREFIGLITASTGFSASGRVLSTSNDLLNELLMLAR